MVEFEVYMDDFLVDMDDIAVYVVELAIYRVGYAILNQLGHQEKEIIMCTVNTNMCNIK